MTWLCFIAILKANAWCIVVGTNVSIFFFSFFFCVCGNIYVKIYEFTMNTKEHFPLQCAASGKKKVVAAHAV